MKKVFLTVELTGENGEHVYAIQYTGVMTRRNIYAKLTQHTGDSQPEYIKVSKYDTVDTTDSWDSVFSGRAFRDITVPYDIALDDSRIKKGPKLFSREILESIQSHIRENEEILATL